MQPRGLPGGVPFEICLLSGDEVILRRPVAGGAVNLGRAPVNDLVLADPAVSWMHCVVWEEAGRVHVRDLGSANGTFAGERRVLGVDVLQPGEDLRLGPSTRARVELVAAAPERRVPMVEQVGTGVRVPVTRDRFHFGGGPGIDVAVPGAAGRVASILVDPDGRAWLGRNDEEILLEEGSEFEVGEWRFRIGSAVLDRAATVAGAPTAYPYALRARLDGRSGPEATVSDPSRGLSYAVEGATKPVLLYLLARQHLADVAAGVPDAERGWCTTQSLQSGVWGRGGNDNRLDVLVCRLRADLREAGFDAWFLERRQGQLRARLVDVEVPTN